MTPIPRRGVRWHSSKVTTNALALALLVLIVAGCAVVPPQSTRGFNLVTPEEYRQQRDVAPARSLDTPRDPQAPDIVLVRPAALQDVSSPTDIELRFLAKDQARIDMRSLRVLYGAFGINVTSRIMKHATLTDLGVVAQEARLPAGSHSITIEISDTRNRVNRVSFRFIVKEAGG